MKRFILFVLVTLFALNSFANELNNSPSSVDDSGHKALALLTNKLNEISSIDASFIQYSVNQSQNRRQESKGVLKANRKGFIYWHTFEPLEQIVSSDGKEVIIYDPDLEQASVQAVGEQLAATPAILFSGELENIAKHFKVSHVLSEGFDEFTLRPLEQESLYELLKVRFNNLNVTELSVVDSLGQISTMSFIQTQVNGDLPDSAFEIKLPEGTDIIRDNPVTQP